MRVGLHFGEAVVIVFGFKSRCRNSTSLSFGFESKKRVKEEGKRKKNKRNCSKLNQTPES